MFDIKVGPSHPVQKAGAWICGIVVKETQVRSGISEKSKKPWAMGTTQILCDEQFVRVTESAPEGNITRLKIWKKGETATFAIQADRADDGQLLVNGSSHEVAAPVAAK